MRTQTQEQYAKRAKEAAKAAAVIPDTFEPSIGGLLVMKHDRDPRDVLYEQLGATVAASKVTGPQILVATYIRPEKTAGGIVITNKTRAEDEYQGKVGMVMAVGPTAFKATKDVDFGGMKVVVGDWVVYSPHDGLPMALRGKNDKMHARLIDDVQVRMVIDHPDMLL